MSNAVTLMPGLMENASLLSKDEKSKLIKCLSLLSKDWRHPGLQTKKVQGQRGDVFECRVDQSIRLIYNVAKEGLQLLYVGRHDDALSYAVRTGPPCGRLVEDITRRRVPRELENLVLYLVEGIEPLWDSFELSDVEARILS